MEILRVGGTILFYCIYALIIIILYYYSILLLLLLFHDFVLAPCKRLLHTVHLDLPTLGILLPQIST